MVRATPEFAATKSVLILLNAPVSEAAAKIVAEPESFEAGDADALGLAVAEAVGDTFLLLQAAAISAVQTNAGRTRRVRLPPCMRELPSACLLVSRGGTGRSG